MPNDDLKLRMEEDGTLVASPSIEVAHVPITGHVVTDPNDPLRGAVLIENSGQKARPLLPYRKSHASGRVKKVIREMSRLAYADRIEVAMDIIDGKPMEMSKIIRTKRKFVQNPSAIIETEAGYDNDDPEAWVHVQISWKETADIPDRLKALEILGKMGGVNLPIEEDGEADEALRNATFIIAFD